MLEPFSLPYVQEALVEILLLSLAAGLLGTWIVLRGLSFYSHAIGTAAFPGLVLADGIGFSAALGAFGAAVLFSLAAAAIGRSRRTATDSVTALVLVGCLAAGVILASDVFSSGGNVDTLLFGSLLLIDGGDIALAAVAAGVAAAATALFRARWLAKGFDPVAAPSLRAESGWLDVVLLGAIALTVTAALTAVGALLVAALMVIPAATVRLFAHRVSTMQVATVALVAVEGVAGLWLSVKTDAPPGATIAVVAGAVFGLAALWRAMGRAQLRLAALGAVGVALVAAGCGSSDGGSGDRVQVVATTTQVADFVREVGGEDVEVSQILEPNTDPHDYEPRPSDVTATADAQIVFRSGGHLDEWADSLVEDSGSDAEVVDLSAGLPVQLHGEEEHDHGHEGEDEHAEDEHAEDEHADDEHAEDEHAEEEGHEHEGEEIDPHWWHDPRNVVAAVAEVQRSLAAADPEDEKAFRRRGAAYAADVEALDAAIAKCVDSVPPARRKMVTDHDAFGYLANRYGIEVVGAVIPALTTAAQPSAGELADLEREIREERVQAVFPESSVSKKLAEAVARDTGASTDYVLYGDTLGPDGSDASTYLEMEAHNADQLMRGLTGGARGCDIGGA